MSQVLLCSSPWRLTSTYAKICSSSPNLCMKWAIQVHVSFTLFGFQIFLALSILDKGYSRNVSCAYHWIYMCFVTTTGPIPVLIDYKSPSVFVLVFCWLCLYSFMCPYLTPIRTCKKECLRNSNLSTFANVLALYEYT